MKPLAREVGTDFHAYSPKAPIRMAVVIHRQKQVAGRAMARVINRTSLRLALAAELIGGAM